MATTTSLMNYMNQNPDDNKNRLQRNQSLFQGEDDELSIDLHDGGPVCESANFASGYNNQQQNIDRSFMSDLPEDFLN